MNITFETAENAAELTAFGRAFQGEVRLFEACPDNEIVEGDALECVECHANICICEECQAEAADGVVTCHSCDREEATRE